MNNSTLNVQHNVTLTEGQISTILYIMEGYLQGSDDNEDTQFTKDCDDIFAKLEGVVDSYYEANKIWLIQTIQAILKTMMNM